MARLRACALAPTATVLDLAAGTGKLTAGPAAAGRPRDRRRAGGCDAGRARGGAAAARGARGHRRGDPARRRRRRCGRSSPPRSTGSAPRPRFARSTACCVRAAASACSGTGRSGRASRGTRPSPRCSTAARAGQGRPANRYTVGEWRATLERSALFGPVRKREFRHVHRVTRAEFLARVASWSVVAVLPEDERAAVLAEVDALLAGAGVTALDLRYRTDTYRARAHPAAGACVTARSPVALVVELRPQPFGAGAHARDLRRRSGAASSS